LEAQERQTYERKQKLKEALASGKQLPTELRKEAKGLGNDLAFDEGQAGKLDNVPSVSSESRVLHMQSLQHIWMMSTLGQAHSIPKLSLPPLGTRVLDCCNLPK
jgi:hypothetical protein